MRSHHVDCQRLPRHFRRSSLVRHCSTQHTVTPSRDASTPPARWPEESQSLAGLSHPYLHRCRTRSAWRRSPHKVSSRPRTALFATSSQYRSAIREAQSVVSTTSIEAYRAILSRLAEGDLEVTFTK